MRRRQCLYGPKLQRRGTPITGDVRRRVQRAVGLRSAALTAVVRSVATYLWALCVGVGR
jgi:hypothetical protein